MKDTPIRIGIIGIGQYSAGIHVPNFRKTGKADIAAISRRNQDLLKLAGENLGIDKTYTDWRQMITEADLDAVVVSTPNYLHAECTIAALKQGLHVLVEKPMALTSKDAQRMIHASKMNNRLLMVGYNCRYLSHWQKARKELVLGRIGVIRQIDAAYAINARWFWERDEKAFSSIREGAMSGALGAVLFAENIKDGHWRSNASQCGGTIFIEVGTHLVDLMLWLTDSVPKMVFACAESGGMSVDAFLSVQARLSKNALMSLHFSEGVSGDGTLFYGRGSLVIHGDKGILEAEWNGWNPSGASVYISSKAERIEFKPLNSDMSPAHALVDAILNNGTNYAPPGECINAVLFSEATYKSLRRQKPINL